MKPDPARAEAIFLAAAEIVDPQERSTFLDRECGDDDASRARVEALLASHDEAGDFLDVSAPSPEMEAEFARLKPEEAGERIGHYKLLQQIGEGGFGVVWMADQEQPVRRRVALKIIKLGMDTKEVIARFEQERQALAMMDHPHIAKVFDAGATQYGRPFFVMELVRGIKITDYCDQASLPTADRLQLFIAVCQAVQHAHQKGIIHRDLKPSNILVTLHDGVPVPKVIDFGVAKAIQARLTERTLFTQFEQMIGTPLYMSPEQAELSGLDIDTRSDIYSLGVLLYELLTGRTPVDRETLERAGFDEIRRIIREQEPPRPSMALQTMAAATRTAVAGHRHVEPPHLIGLLRGDLDWIVMKALEKDRSRRYDTATALAEDLRRHLVFEPVIARPPSRLYRFRRMVKRNKLAVTASAAVAVAILVGGTVSTVLFFKEKAERQRAVAAERNASEQRQRAEANASNAITEATKSRQVAAVLKDMLTGVSPLVSMGRDTTLLREILDKTAQRVGRDFKDQPEVEAELRSTLGYGYECAHRAVESEAMYQESLRLYRMLFGTEHAKVADALEGLGRAQRLLKKLAEAEATEREVVALRRKLFGTSDPTVARALQNLLWVLMKRNDKVEAEKTGHEALAANRRAYGAEHREVAWSLNMLGQVISMRGDREAADAMFREALTMQRKVAGENSPDTAWMLVETADAMSERGDFAKAEALIREAMLIGEKIFEQDSEDYSRLLSKFGNCLLAQEKFSEAEPPLRQSIGIREKKLAGTWLLSEAVGRLGASLSGQKKYVEAEPLLLSGYEGLKQREAIVPEDRMRECLQRVAQFYEVTGQAVIAAEWKQKLDAFNVQASRRR